MLFKKCPLCSGTVRNGQCIDCGYYLPDERDLENMSSIYDFDPDTYPEPPDNELGAEEMYTGEQYAPPKADDPPKVEVGYFGDPAKLPTPPPQPVNQNNTNGSSNSKKTISISAANIRIDHIIYLLISLAVPIPVVGLILCIKLFKEAKSPTDRFVGIICLILGIL